MMKDKWTFDQPRNCAVITLRQIANGSEPILRVLHDADDHGWQFLTLADASKEDASVIALSEVVEIDPSVLQIAYIPPGWHAWRKTVDDDWKCEESCRD